MITARERIIAALEHRELDRLPICEQAIWPETLQRWEKEGMSKGGNLVELYKLDNMSVFHPFDCSFFPHEIYEDNAEYCVDLNGQGTTVKWYKNRGSSSGHSELDHKVKTIEDWREAKSRLKVTSERFRPIPAYNKDRFTAISAIDHFWTSFTMLGMENMCLWLAGEPENLMEMYNDYTDFLVGMLDLCMARKIEFDGIWFFSDMAYCGGPMFSPATYREVIRPGYDRIRKWCSANNKYLFLHCDGNLDILLPEFIETGFDMIHPLEARAGNDIRKIKEKYDEKITLMGNINADVLARGNRAEIEDEIASKITIAKKGGGYIYNIDHSVPPTISFENLVYAIELVKKYGKY